MMSEVKKSLMYFSGPSRENEPCVCSISFCITCGKLLRVLRCCRLSVALRYAPNASSALKKWLSVKRLRSDCTLKFLPFTCKLSNTSNELLLSPSAVELPIVLSRWPRGISIQPFRYLTVERTCTAFRGDVSNAKHAHRLVREVVVRLTFLRFQGFVGELEIASIPAFLDGR